LSYYSLHDSGAIILSKPPHYINNCFGHGVRRNCPFWLDSSPKNMVSRHFLPNSHITLVPDFLAIYMPSISHFSVTSCRALHWFHSAHSTPASISSGIGKTWPLHLALHGTLVWWSLPILTIRILFLPLSLTFWPFGIGESGPWLHRLEMATYCPRFIFWFCKFSLGDTLGCLLHNLTKLGPKGNLKPKTSVFLQKFGHNRD
jgi:hypothetical protein